MTMYTLKQKLGEICRYFIAAVINTGIINLSITRTTMAIAVRDGPPNLWYKLVKYQAYIMFAKSLIIKDVFQITDLSEFVYLTHLESVFL